MRGIRVAGGSLVGKLWVAASLAVAFGLVSAAELSGQVVPPPVFVPLNQIHVPQPTNAIQYITNEATLTQLGKALFWDMQVGSDGKTACATCHFSAGADSRRWNSLNPGTHAGDTVFGNNPRTGQLDYPQFGPNYTLVDNDFPFHRRDSPFDVPGLPILADTNDVVGSQGVHWTTFVRVEKGNPVDVTTPDADPIFNVNGTNTRRVTARNAPTVINAVYNFTQFYDGRAHFIFNGENPFGPLDQNAGVWFNEPVDPLDPLGPQHIVKRPVAIEFASLASQAVGPPVDDTEMSATGRTFPDIGRKMLSLVPLGQQLVHPQDSQLGDLSAATLHPDGRLSGSRGLTTTYRALIESSFHDVLWNGTDLTPDGFEQIEANFAFFFGMAIQYYEATLISDQTPFDHWLGGDTTAMSPEAIEGFGLFVGIGNCVLCHAGTEFTTASHSVVAFIDNGNNAAIEMMFASDGRQVIYDDGFINSAVTPTTEDLGRHGLAPAHLQNPLDNNNPFPLSFSLLAGLQAQGKLPFQTPLLPFTVGPDMPTATRGAFKVPGLRNVELTGPYFHNGSVLTLGEVLDFYARAGNFPQENLVDMDPVIGQGLLLIQGQHAKHLKLVEFLKALTDPRVAANAAPFDHPEIFIPEGEPEILHRLPATDTNGAPAPDLTLMLSPVTSPTNLATQYVWGTFATIEQPQVTVTPPAVAGAVTVSGNTWSSLISGLAEGPNLVTVSVQDGAVLTTVNATIVRDTVAPALTLDPVVTPTRYSSQFISGTVERGIVPVVTAEVPALAGAVTMVDARTWRCQITNIPERNTAVDIEATDDAGNVALVTADITVDTIPPSLTLDPVLSPTGLIAPLTGPTTQTLTGVVEAGIIPEVHVAPKGKKYDAIIGAGSTTWSVLVDVLEPGPNIITVIATDLAGNLTSLSAVISVEAGIFGKASGTLGSLAGTLITLKGPAVATAICDARGNYHFTGLPNGTYTLTPSLPGFAFTPATLSVTLAAGAAAVDANFTGVPVYAVSGVVRDALGRPLAGVKLALGGPATMTTVTNRQGRYLLRGVPDGTYTLTPSRTGYAFKPVRRRVVVQGGNQANQNFTGRTSSPLSASR